MRTIKQMLWPLREANKIELSNEHLEYLYDLNISGEETISTEYHIKTDRFLLKDTMISIFWWVIVLTILIATPILLVL